MRILQKIRDEESIMKKYVKLALCGMAAAALVTGCGKKNAEETTAAPTESSTPSDSTEAAAAEKEDPGKLTKLGTYKGVEVKKNSTEVTPEELEKRIQGILDANPEYIEITDRPAQNGDIVNIDFVGMKDGEAFDGGTAEDFPLELGSNSFIDGFEEGLVGAEAGSELSLNLTFPEDYFNADLAGQEVVFDVTVNSIEEKKEAVLDENFVQRMSDFTTVDEFKADTLADMEQEKETMAENQLEYDAFMAALDNSEFELNEEAVEQQYEAQLNYYTSMVQMYGMTMDDYVAAFGMTMDDFQKELRTAAENALKQELLVDAVAEEEKLEVTDEDRQKVADQYGTDIQNMKDTYGEEALDRTALVYKVQALVKDNAVVK